MATELQPHLYCTSPLHVWWALIRAHGGIPRRYWRRFAGILYTSTLTAPLRVAERLRYGHQVARTDITEPPVYIHGFARTGTTHLHNLLAHDPNFGYVSHFQALTSSFFLISRGRLERRIAERLPKTRPMDNVALALDLPQEEELALGGISPLSAVHQFSFPSRARQIMEKFAAMQLTDAELRQWERKYLEVLRKATLASGGRRLVLKSPANLGRTRHILRLFPGAKFIFIIRNPYVVYSSMMNLYRKTVPLFQLQDVDWQQMESAMLDFFVSTVGQYMRDRETIPEGNLVEVKFEDIEADALGTLERIYGELSLPDWAQARKPIADYLETLSRYRKNSYQFDQSLIDKIDRKWGFAIREWGYEP